MAKTDRSSVVSGDKEDQAHILPESDNVSGRKRGGWTTFPFVIATTALLNLASFGWVSNLMVYLIEEFNVKSIDAAQIINIVRGCVNLFPVITAIIADSFLGSFSLICISSLITFLGTILLTLTASIESLRPQPCATNASNFCQGGSKFQLAVLFAGIALMASGTGGFRFSTATMGADQFDNPKAQGIFFNWFFFTFYLAAMVGSTVLVFVEDSVSWGLGFGMCTAAYFFGLTIFLSGSRFYRKLKPQGSPFTGLARVVVAAFRKRKLALSEDYHYDYLDGNTDNVTKLSSSFRFLNRAAQKTEGDVKPDGSSAKPWRLCTVQQVEDFKTVIKMFPVWSTGILLHTPITMTINLTILQAMKMDRHVGINSNFQIPPGSLIVLILLSSFICIAIIDRFLIPTWQKLTGQLPTPLQRIGVGHVLNVLAMAASALVEYKRLKMHENNYRMNVALLFPQLILIGTGEAFHFPGSVSLFYQEFPATLSNISTGISGLLIGIGFYLSTALIDLIRRVTGWLPNDINKGRLDNVYWVLVVMGMLNFVYYLVLAKLYKYRTI